MNRRRAYASPLFGTPTLTPPDLLASPLERIQTVLLKAAVHDRTPRDAAYMAVWHALRKESRVTP